MIPGTEYTTIKCVAFQVAEVINIKAFKNDFTGDLLYGSNYELFYHIENDTYLYVLNYGVIIFANYNVLDASNFMDLIKKYSEGVLENRHKEDFLLVEDPEKEISFTFNSLSVPKINHDVIKVTMLYVGQSVALDYYTETSQLLLNQMTDLTQKLEKFGKLKISKRDLMRFIGKTLNTKNSIIDNLYVLDAPDVAWENEYLAKISSGLSTSFDLRLRFREVEYTLRIIEGNLNIFTELMQNKESSTLEIIIIALILIEVLNLIVEKLF